MVIKCAASFYHCKVPLYHLKIKCAASLYRAFLWFTWWSVETSILRWPAARYNCAHVVHIVHIVAARYNCAPENPSSRPPGGARDLLITWFQFFLKRKNSHPTKAGQNWVLASKIGIHGNKMNNNDKVCQWSDIVAILLPPFFSNYNCHAYLSLFSASIFTILVNLQIFDSMQMFRIALTLMIRAWKRAKDNVMEGPLAQAQSGSILECSVIVWGACNTCPR